MLCHDTTMIVSDRTYKFCQRAASSASQLHLLKSRTFLIYVSATQKYEKSQRRIESQQDERTFIANCLLKILNINRFLFGLRVDGRRAFALSNFHEQCSKCLSALGFQNENIELCW